MNTITADEQGRLACGGRIKPGRAYRLVEDTPPGELRLVELPPVAPARPTREEVLQRLRGTTWRPAAGWDELRGETRG